MGGINHQPCGKYLSRSTQASRFLSAGMAQLELANVAFEDLILEELNGLTGKVDGVTDLLLGASGSLNNLIHSIDDLVEFMRESKYEDLSPLRRLDLESIGRDFISRGLVNHSWDEACKILLRGGYFAMFRHLRAQAVVLLEITEQLRKAFLLLRPAADARMVARTMEENMEGNVRPIYAHVYTRWHAYHSLFLASSLISAEVWYAFNGYGSMSIINAKLRLA